MKRTLCCAGLLVLALAVPAQAADASKWSIKSATVELPKDIAEPVRTLLSDRAIQVFDGDNKLVCDLWFRKQLAAKATPQEVQKGLNYRHLEQSTVVGAVRFAQQWTDFRKQSIKAGTYTLRMGFQPMDGDHMGTAPYTEFCLLAPAADDKKPAILEAKALHELSAKSIPGGSHPAAMLLFPNAKPEDAPKFVSKGNGIWVLNWKEDVTAGDQKTVLGLGLTLFGHTSE
ncbi:MAG: hypothetical protein K2R98_25515 [Gemmataceae bacterium]|nr:hypothetical protein [Gemmataceae bacterium]